MDDQSCVGSGSCLFPVDTGIYWSGSVLRRTHQGHDRHNTRQAPTKAETSRYHRFVMETDPTVLGQSPFRASESFDSLGCSPRFVSLSFVISVIRSLT